MPWKLMPELLLCPNVPKPMHGLAPRVVLGSGWWNKERQAAYASTNYRCQACGVHKDDAKRHQWLEGHESYEIDYRLGRMVYVCTHPLCHYCHNFVHDGRLANLLEHNQIAHYKYAAIIQHGEEILAEAGLKRPSREQRDLDIGFAHGKVAAWSKWRLILQGKEYPPKFKNQIEYEKHWKEVNDA